MDKRLIISHIDHTLLKQEAKWEQIMEICKEGMEQKTASICIPPSFVSQASAFVQGKVAICTVVGFPNGYQTTATKVFETSEAINNGADEIDMVIHLGWLKEGLYQKIFQEINAIKYVCGDRILKVIVETCLLTEEEKIRMCEIVSHSKADYIKTSTGFSTGGATLADIQLFAKHVFGDTKIKAAGGIKSIQDAEDFLQAGADRLGSSSLLNMLCK
ncbi:deoxyribose-phosphate aldolase [Anaerotignum neopropionicum]|uniref:Deoxyribose-phosphate aldolase n=1 Tax=Anaerotignum neopropionicum TaxID=36847 RepID=A0A136WDJ2_9FIRM|nr:deoxyribose-phosphate aldolase [Anaerotignum neopropionicum]KXL52554.1 deoxyribose-phosphate aldolase [Anaerotignum neopropionicum]